MRFGILGPLEVEEGGHLLPLGGARQRALLAVLLLHADEVVSTDRLIDALWGEQPPETAGHALQVYVSQVRKVLGSGGHRDRRSILVTRSPGYMLRTEGHELDLRVFEELVAEGRRASAAGAPARAADTIGAALDLWRGPPLAEFAFEAFAQTEIARLEELRLSALEDRIDADLAVGRHAELVSELQTLVAEHPLRERLRGQLMLALYRSDRQAEALQAYRDAGQALAEELGVDPAPALQRLEKAILEQDPGLAPPGPRDGPGVGAEPSAGVEPSVAIRTFLIADVRGYTAFTQERGDEAAGRLAARFAELARTTVAAREGSVIEVRGDEALAVFNSARQAMLTAVELQARFVEETVADPELPLAVGIGLDAGEAVRLEGGYRGGALNRAARLCAVAGPGEILATREIVHLAGKTEGVTYAERGSARLKGVADPVDLVGVKPEGWDPAQDLAFRRALGPAARTVPAAPGFEPANPYKGLRPFEEADAALFFGREALTQELITRMGGASFLAVVGPSGSGKSSVVRAGLIPAIRRGALPGSERWQVVEMLPGAHVLEELEAALLRAAVNPPASLLEQLERDDHGLLRAVKRVLPADDSVLVLVVDQLEEVFTLVEDEDRRTLFLSAIAAAVADPRRQLRVVTTLRADFYDRPLLYRGFADLVRSYIEAVVPLSPDELERAIVNPAKRVDVSFEPGLLPEILAEVVDEPGALPLLQYAMTELFDRREGTVLSLDAYHAIGGVAGALAGRADELFRALDATEREAGRQLFLRLITLGEGTEDTRRRVPRSELEAMEVDQHAMARALDAFGASRLLSFDRDARSRAPTVEVAHEALLRTWGRLRGWIEEAREDVRAHRRLSAATGEWLASDRDPSFLLRGSRLAQFEAWVATARIALTAHERDYVDASLRERAEQEAAEEARRAREAALERRSVNRLRAVVVVLTLAALVASALTVVASRERGRAEQQARIATARELASAALVNLEVDPERSILLALEAVDTTRSVDGTVLREAEEALHQAVQASRAVMRLDVAPAVVEYSRDGTRLATAGTNSAIPGDTPAAEPDRQAVVWDAATGERLLTLAGHRDRVWDVEFSQDGSRLATASEDGTAAIWDGETGERLLTFRGLEPDSYAYLDFSADGTRLIASDGGLTQGPGTVRVWDVRTGSLIRRWSTPGGICGIVFSPDGLMAGGGLCGEGGGAAFVWDARTGAELLRLEGHPDLVFDLVFSPDGSRIATAGIEGVAKIWDAATGEEINTLIGHGGLVTATAFSPDGDEVATGSTDGTARVWDAATGAELMVLAGFGGGIGDVEFSPDGGRLLTGGSESAVVWDVTPEGSREQVTLAAPGAMTSVAYSPDGRRLATTSWEKPGGQARLWDAATGQELTRFSGPEASFDSAFGLDGTSLATVAVEGSPVVWDTGTGEPALTLGAEGFIGSLAFSPDGSMIATGLGVTTRGNALVLWDSASGEELGALAEVTGEIDDLEFSPDGTLLASVSYDGSVIVWDLADGEALRSFSGHAGGVAGVAFGPDGKLIASSGFDETARLWRVATGKQVHALVGHTGAVWDVAFSPDGATVATAGDDGTARLWDVATGRELLTLTGHTSGLTELAFSPDGTRLATSSNDGTVRVYVLPLEELMGIARERLTRTWTAEECRRYLQLPRCEAPSS